MKTVLLCLCFPQLVDAKKNNNKRVHGGVWTLTKEIVNFVLKFSVGSIFAKLLSCTSSRTKQRLKTISKYFWARSCFATFVAPQRECEKWGTVQSWASTFYPHTHRQDIHVNIIYVGTSVFSVIWREVHCSSQQHLLSKLSESLVIPTYSTYLRFLVFFIKQDVRIFTEKNVKKIFSKAQKVIRNSKPTYGHKKRQNLHKLTHPHSNAGSLMIKGCDWCRRTGKPSVNVFVCFFWLWNIPVKSDSALVFK